MPFQKRIFIARCLNTGSLCESASNCNTVHPPWTLRMCAGSFEPLALGASMSLDLLNCPGTHRDLGVLWGCIPCYRLPWLISRAGVLYTRVL